MRFFFLFFFFLVPCTNLQADADNPVTETIFDYYAKKTTFLLNIGTDPGNSGEKSKTLKSEEYDGSFSFIEGLKKYSELMSPQSLGCLTLFGESLEGYREKFKSIEYTGDEYYVQMSFDKDRKPYKLAVANIQVSGYYLESGMEGEPVRYAKEVSMIYFFNECNEKNILAYLKQIYQERKDKYENYSDLMRELESATQTADQ